MRLWAIKVIIVPIVKVCNFHRGRLVVHVFRVLRCLLHIKYLIGSQKSGLYGFVEVVVFHHRSISWNSLALFMGLWPQFFADFRLFHPTAICTEAPGTLTALLLK
jgi:hypothetical protein